MHLFSPFSKKRIELVPRYFVILDPPAGRYTHNKTDLFWPRQFCLQSFLGVGYNGISGFTLMPEQVIK